MWSPVVASVKQVVQINVPSVFLAPPSILKRCVKFQAVQSLTARFAQMPPYASTALPDSGVQLACNAAAALELVLKMDAKHVTTLQMPPTPTWPLLHIALHAVETTTAKLVHLQSI